MSVTGAVAKPGVYEVDLGTTLVHEHLLVDMYETTLNSAGVLLDELTVIPGSVPNLISLPEGCRFAPRCGARIEHNNVLATEHHPEFREAAPGHQVRCWLYHHEDGSPRPDPDTWPAVHP